MNVSLSADPTLTESLYEFARDLENLALRAGRPRLRDVEWRQGIEDACEELSARAQVARQALSKRYESLGPSLEEAVACIRAYRAELADGPTAARLKAKAQTLSETYEDLRRRLRRTSGIGTFVRAPRLERMKPINYRRNLFHVGMGLAAATIYEFLLTQGQAILILSVLLGVAVSFEVTRRVFPKWNKILIRFVFRGVVRPWENRRPNSASWYTLALLIITVLTPRLAAEIGVLVLAFGDPAASIIGRKWGRVKLYRRKSFVGSLAFAVAAAALTVGMALLKSAPLSPWALAGMAVTVALASAAAELFSDSVDDNATVPVTAACMATLWLGI
jgi:dolichol kinase